MKIIGAGAHPKGRPMAMKNSPPILNVKYFYMSVCKAIWWYASEMSMLKPWVTVRGADRSTDKFSNFVLAYVKCSLTNRKSITRRKPPLDLGTKNDLLTY